MQSLIYQSAVILAQLIREQKVTSSAIVQAHLEHIQKHNDKVHALISIFKEEALLEALKCDREAKEGKFRGPLHGVPITIKEQFWIKEKQSNTNFKLLRGFTAPKDAVTVERIRESGAIILGQTNVPKNVLDYQVKGDLYPEGKNPYHADYTPGGSTGGGAAALAAGFTPLELGADLGGSIRVPASFCGLYGLKPTDKTVPLQGIIPMPKNAKTFLFPMAQAGPLARNPDDLELLWKIILGPHESDRNTPDINWQAPSEKGLNEYKVAWTDAWPSFETSTPVSQSIETLIQDLKNNGCTITKKIPDETLHQESLEVFAGIFPYIVSQGSPWFIRILIKNRLFNTILKGAKKELSYLIKPMNEAFKMNANHYAEVMLQRNKITERWENFFKEYDFLICPVAFGPAYKRCKMGDKLEYDAKEMIYIKYVFPYVACFNASGNPAITIPIGLSPEGLPIGVQIVGKYWSEPELIHFARQISKITSGFIKPCGFD